MSTTPHYQAVMSAIAAVFAAEQQTPGSVGLDRIRELAIMARTVMPNMTAADIVAIGDRKFEALSILAAAAEKMLGDLGTALKAQLNSLHADIDADLDALSDTAQAAIGALRAGSETAINDLYTAKAGLLEALAADKTSEVTGLIDMARLAAISAITTARDAATASLTVRRAERGILIADFARFVEYGAAPLTSELPQTYNSSHAERLFRLLLGMGDGSNNVRHNRVPRQILPFSRAAAAVGISQDYTEYAGSSSQYNYPTFNLAALFLKNPTAAPVSTTVSAFLSSYWGSGYEGAQIFQVTPNRDNGQRAATSALTFQGLWSYQSSATTSRAQPVTVPANTTVAVVVASTDRYFTNSSGYQFNKDIGFYALNTTLAPGLTIDMEVTEAAFMRDLAAPHEAWSRA